MSKLHSTRNRISVYFFQIGDDGPIKIGQTGFDPWPRYIAINQGVPYRLRFLAYIPYANPEMEARLHEQFAAHRIKGEWFHPHDDILEYIRLVGVKPPPRPRAPHFP